MRMVTEWVRIELPAAVVPDSGRGTRVRVYVFAAARCGAAAGQAVPRRRWRAGYRLTAHVALPAGLVS
jgi:hypothetical protein